MKMQVHFWENAEVTHHCHLASSSSSSSQFLLLGWTASCFFLLKCLLLRDSLESQAAKVPRQSEELVEMIATVTAKRHHPPVD